MSWQSYVDDHLMCDVEGNRLTSAAILGQDGSVWAQSSNFPQFKPEEITGVMNDFQEPGTLAPTGLFLGGTKYMVIQGEPGAVIRGKKGPGGVTIKKTNQALVIGIYDEALVNGLWWLKLPYVLRILMRGNVDEEVSEGFFTLRTNSAEENEAESSHTVAFEDQQDAKNFCYLLESGFEDLGGFSTDIIPTSTKDLHDEVSSRGKNVIVVKKRQLTLYAGQPFEDVERALHSLIQQHWK